MRTMLSPRKFHVSFKVKRVISLLFGVVVMLGSGTLYGFGVVGPSIKSKLSYDQTDINQAIAIGDTGIYLGISMGYLFDRTGPRLTCLVSSLLVFLGYLLTYFQVRGNFPSSWLLLSFFLFLVGQGSFGAFSASIFSNFQNFDHVHRGKISGLLLGAFAISSGIFAKIFDFSFRENDNIEAYLLMLAFLLGVLIFLGSFFIQILPRDEDVIFSGELKGRLELVGTLPKENFLSKFKGKSKELFKGSMSPKKERSSEFDRPFLILNNENIVNNNNNNNVDDINDLEPDDMHEIQLDREDNLKVSDSLEPQDGAHTLSEEADVTGWKLLKTVEFWLIFFTFFVGTGSGLTWMNNIGSLVISLGKVDGYQNTLILIFSIANLTGRFVSGFLSDILAQKIPRATFLAVSSFLICITHFLFAMWSDQLLIFCTIITGIAYGGVLAMVTTLVSLMFGLKHFGTNFGLINFAPATSGYIFGVIAGRIYDSQADSTHQCFSTNCFKLTYLLTSLMTFLGTISCIVLILKTRRPYQNGRAFESLKSNIPDKIEMDELGKHTKDSSMHPHSLSNNNSEIINNGFDTIVD